MQVYAIYMYTLFGDQFLERKLLKLFAFLYLTLCIQETPKRVLLQTVKIYSMDYTKFIISNQKEESISIQRVKNITFILMLVVHDFFI